MTKKLKKQIKGFTLIELMVVMAIIAILSTLIVGAIILARSTAAETANRSNAKTIQTALEGQFAKYREYCAPAAGNGEIICGVDSIDGIRAKLAAQSVTVNLSTGGSGAGNELGGGRVAALTGSSYAIAVTNSNDNAWTSVQDYIQVNIAAPYTTLTGAGSPAR